MTIKDIVEKFLSIFRREKTKALPSGNERVESNRDTSKLNKRRSSFISRLQVEEMKKAFMHVLKENEEITKGISELFLGMQFKANGIDDKDICIENIEDYRIQQKKELDKKKEGKKGFDIAIANMRWWDNTEDYRNKSSMLWFQLMKIICKKSSKRIENLLSDEEMKKAIEESMEEIMEKARKMGIDEAMEERESKKRKEAIEKRKKAKNKKILPVEEEKEIRKKVKLTDAEKEEIKRQIIEDFQSNKESKEKETTIRILEYNKYLRLFLDLYINEGEFYGIKYAALSKGEPTGEKEDGKRKIIKRLKDEKDVADGILVEIALQLEKEKGIEGKKKNREEVKPADEKEATDESLKLIDNIGTLREIIELLPEVTAANVLFDLLDVWMRRKKVNIFEQKKGKYADSKYSIIDLDFFEGRKLCSVPDELNMSDDELKNLQEAAGSLKTPSGANLPELQRTALVPRGEEGLETR